MMEEEVKAPQSRKMIHCKKCGEEYAAIYTRCPFCNEQPSQEEGGGLWTRSPRDGRRVTLMRLVLILLALALVIWLLYVALNKVAPILGWDEWTPFWEQSQSVDGSSGDTSQEEPEQPPAVQHVNSLRLNHEDITLTPGEMVHIRATVVPADAKVTWATSDASAARVSDDGTVVNINTGFSTAVVTITATAGDKSAQCIVRCQSGAVEDPQPSGEEPASTAAPATPTAPAAPTTPTAPVTTTTSTGVVYNARNGLRVRATPSKDATVIASLYNGNRITILGEASGGWYKVSFIGSDGAKLEGYVSKDYVTVR